MSNPYPFTHAVISREPIGDWGDSNQDWKLDNLCRSQGEADRAAERLLGCAEREKQAIETMIVNWPTKSLCPRTGSL